MKTLRAEIALMAYLNVRQNIVVPCVSGWGGLLRFEADMLKISKAGYASVFEIKVTKADLKADLNKRHIKACAGTMRSAEFQMYYGSLKHFSYVVPEKLREDALKQIPNFCGLYVVELVDNQYAEFSYYEIKEVRRPKKLGGRPWSREEQLKVAHLGAMRVLGLKLKLVGPMPKRKKQKSNEEVF